MCEIHEYVLRLYRVKAILIIPMTVLSIAWRDGPFFFFFFSYFYIQMSTHTQWFEHICTFKYHARLPCTLYNIRQNYIFWCFTSIKWKYKWFVPRNSLLYFTFSNVWELLTHRSYNFHTIYVCAFCFRCTDDCVCYFYYVFVEHARFLLLCDDLMDERIFVSMNTCSFLFPCV